MSNLFFISHPQVVVAPAVPVTKWCLSAEGRARMIAFSAHPALRDVHMVWSSSETKAVECADILAQTLEVQTRELPQHGENDRSSTGYLPPSEFELMADLFFRHPDESQRGWETARAAQTRIHTAVREIVEQHSTGSVAVVSHGAVGTLLMCALAGLPICRKHDQPYQGHYWVADLQTLSILHTWRPLGA